MVDVAKDSFEMDYDLLERSITDKTKVIIPVDLGGIMCDYHKIFDIVQRKKNKFCPSNKIQESIGRVIIVSDAAHAFGASRNGKMCGELSDFTSFSFHAVKNLTTADLLAKFKITSGGEEFDNDRVLLSTEADE